MTPEQKANDLIAKFYEETESGLTYEDVQSRATACAIIHCEGVIEEIDTNIGQLDDDHVMGYLKQRKHYHQSVLSLLRQKQ